MYYYIFDIKRCIRKNQVESIKSHLTSLGISGEYTYITPNQSAEALAESGINKGYSTIVAIGSDDLVNAISNVMVGRKEVLGVLPLSVSEDLKELLGTREWQDAAEALRYRRIKELRIGHLSNGKHFLTNIYLDLLNRQQVELELKDVSLSTLATNLLISNFHTDIEKHQDDELDIVLESTSDRNPGFFEKLLSRKKHSPNEENITYLKSPFIRIFTKKPVSLVCGDKIIAKTPQNIELTAEKIRLIVAKNI